LEGLALEIDRKRCSHEQFYAELKSEAVMLHIVPALSIEAIGEVQKLFREYALMPGVAPCVEDFEREVSALPGQYAPPRGRLFLAMHERLENIAEAAGCAALRELEPVVCEMKRLYVRPAVRGEGAGRKLVEALIAEARSVGYRRMVLDTLPSMQEAHKLYRALGFREIPPYPKKPIPGALFFEYSLS
jgi:putative acetyltransferase